jgi:transmembrane sensor
MEHNKDTYFQILAKYFSNNATAEEMQYIEHEKENSQEYREAFYAAQRVWEKTNIDSEYVPDVEKGWQRLQLKAQMRVKKEVPKKYANLWWGVAASISLILLSTFILFRNLPVTKEQLWVEQIAGVGEIKEVLLPDGSKIWLNAGSRLSYPENFLQKNREVKLIGEAFFQVEKAEGKRFTVYAGNSRTEVIGTSFNVNARKDHVIVQVVTGKVAFGDIISNESLFLEPGQQGLLTAGQFVAEKSVIEDQNFQAWKTKNLVFNDAPLPKLIEKLEDYFDVSIYISDSKLANCRFTVSFQDPNLEDALDLISITGNLEVLTENGKYILTGVGCK